MKESNKELSNSVSKMSVLLAGISLPTYGYDARKTKDGKTQLYEILPNGKELKTDVESEEMFGYNPYATYKTLGYTGGEKLNFTEVNKILEDAQNNNTTVSDYLSLGNGLYFFKQQVNRYSGPGQWDDSTWVEKRLH